MSRPSSYRITSAGSSMLGTTLHIAKPDKDGCGEVSLLHSLNILEVARVSAIQR
jgi:hypothetical protein